MQPITEEATTRLLIVRSKDELSPRLRYNIEGVSRIGHSFLVNGWIVDPEKRCAGLFVRKPAGKRLVRGDNRWIRFDRPDVRDAFPSLLSGGSEKNGFVFLVEELADAEDVTKLNISVVTNDGRVFGELVDVREITSFRNAIDLGFGLIGSEFPNVDICENFLRPLVDSALPLKVKPKLLSTVSFGPQPDNPHLSVIIPIYGGLSLMQYQIGNLLATWDDGVEYIFAIDDPNLVTGAMRMAQRLTALLPVGFRIVAPDRNLGFAGINNFAANQSKGRNLLLLNSDCFPVVKDCYLRVTRLLDSKAANLIGARLLFSDRTIQHDGLAFEKRADFPGFVLNTHPNKGIPESLIKEENPAEPSCALTAAFLAVSRVDYDELGGLDEGYIRGDFEDSDFCLKAIAKGMKLGIVRDMTVYHLERQSQHIGLDNSIAMKITLTNAARQMAKWKDLIGKDLPKIEVLK